MDKNNTYIKFNAYIIKSLNLTRITYINNIIKNKEQYIENINYDYDCSFENKIFDNVIIKELINKSRISNNEIKILELYYYYGYTDKEIGKIFNSSKQYINKKRKIIMNKLKNSL